MADRLRVQCPEGDFAVEPYDEDETIRFLQDHARAEHGLEIDRDELHEVVQDEASVGIE